MRSLEDLIDEKDPAWPLVKEWIAGAGPDTLSWLDFDFGYSAWLVKMMHSDLDDFCPGIWSASASNSRSRSSLKHATTTD